MVVVMDAETLANNVSVSAICVFYLFFSCDFCFCRCGFYAPDIIGVIFDLNVKQFQVYSVLKDSSVFLEERTSHIKIFLNLNT